MDPYISPDATIGAGTLVYPGAYIGAHVTIGRDCIIQSGARIGQDGFGYQQDEADRWVAKPHLHRVVIEDDVHVGANACIDRGSWRDTLIEQGARIDNLCHVAHNARIGRNAVLVAQAEISGSVEVGEGAWISPRACVLQRTKIGARALVGMGAVVLCDVPPDQTWAGVPARCIDTTQGVRDEM